MVITCVLIVSGKDIYYWKEKEDKPRGLVSSRKKKKSTVYRIEHGMIMKKKKKNIRSYWSGAIQPSSRQ